MATMSNRHTLSYCVLLAFDSCSLCDKPQRCMQAHEVMCHQTQWDNIWRLSHTSNHNTNLPWPCPLLVTTPLIAAAYISLAPRTTTSAHISPKSNPITAAYINKIFENNASAFVCSAEEKDVDRDKDIEERNNDKDANELNFSVIWDSMIAKDTLDAQKMAHLLFELNRAALKLGQLGDILNKTVMSTSDISWTVMFVKKLETLTSQLKCMIVNVQPPSKSENVVEDPSIAQVNKLLSTPPHHTKWSSGVIMGPSPEKA